MRISFSLSFFVSVFIIALASISAQADGTMPVNQPTFIYDILPDTNYGTILDFRDGRKAAFFEATGQALLIPITINQTENTCDPDLQLVSCVMNIAAAPYSGWVKWIVHPDPKKVGKVLHVKQTSLSNPANPQVREFDLSDETNGTITGYFAKFFNSTYDYIQLPADQIRCNSFEWTNKMDKSSGLVRIDSMTAETMATTRETNVSENQTISGAYNVVLKQSDTKTLEFVRTGPDYPIHNSFPGYLSSGVLNLNFKSIDKHICQIAFQSDISTAVATIGNPNFRKIDQSTYRPIKNSSAFFQIESNIINNLGQMKSGGGYDKVEVE